MTLKDLLKRIPKKDYNKVLVYDNGKGWTNVWFKNDKDSSTITLYNENNTIFTEDKK